MRLHGRKSISCFSRKQINKCKGRQYIPITTTGTAHNHRQPLPYPSVIAHLRHKTRELHIGQRCGWSLPDLIAKPTPESAGIEVGKIHFPKRYLFRRRSNPDNGGGGGSQACIICRVTAIYLGSQNVHLQGCMGVTSCRIICTY